MLVRSTFLVFSFLISFSLLAQKSALRSKGDTLFQKKVYYQAISCYRNVVSADSQEICHCKKRLAKCYDFLGDPATAAELHREILKSCKTDVADLRSFGRVLLKMGEYEKAKRLFATCYQADSTDRFSFANRGFCDTVKQAMDRLTDTYLENISELNSGSDDVVSEANQDTLWVLSARKVRKKESKNPANNQYAYRSYFWYPAKPIELVGEGEGTSFSCQDGDGTDLYFSQMETNSGHSLTHRSVIYRTRQMGDKPQRFAYDDDSSSFGHPNLSTDGTLFFFVSDMPGGHGGTDIYYCRKVGTKWTKPLNAGSEVNTANNELFPFYVGEGVLVFSSEGKAGFGGYDLYASKLSGEQFTFQYHLPWPINSRGDDLSFRCDKTKKTFYLSSNRPKGKGALDVYKIHHFTIASLRGVF